MAPRIRLSPRVDHAAPTLACAPKLIRRPPRRRGSASPSSPRHLLRPQRLRAPVCPAPSSRRPQAESSEAQQCRSSRRAHSKVSCVACFPPNSGAITDSCFHAISRHPHLHLHLSPSPSPPTPPPTRALRVHRPPLPPPPLPHLHHPPLLLHQLPPEYLHLLAPRPRFVKRRRSLHRSGRWEGSARRCGGEGVVE